MEDVYDGHVVEAISKLRAIVARDPRNTLARRDLGACYVSRHQYAPARAELSRVEAAASNDYMTQYELGIADEHLGFIEQALDHLETACRLAPEAEQCKRELDSVRKKK